MPLTKIIATIGPSIQDYNTLKKIAISGMDCIRINTAHASIESVALIAGMRKKIEKETGKVVSIMIDLKGEELRILTKDGDVEIKEGMEYTITDSSFKNSRLAFNVGKAIDAANSGDIIVAMDGKVSLEVKTRTGNSLKVTAKTDGVIKNMGRLNIPGRYVPLASITERDRQFLQAGIDNAVEYCAMSFVQTSAQINELHDIIMSMKGQMKVIAKIETRKALDNISEIVSVSDVIMVARGDLGVEVPLSEVGMAQKEIIRAAHRRGVPTIVATQILESMVNSESPTRAEVSDITNAILDNADSLMLSEETAIGKYPEEAVKTLVRIASYVEGIVVHFPGPEDYLGNRVTFSISKATRVISDEVESDAIVVLTRTGNTARMVSAVRPSMKIIAVVKERVIAGFTTLLRGVTPIILDSEISDSVNLNEIISFIREKGMIKPGERIVVTSGIPEMVFGGTTEVKVVTVGDVIGRGFATGTDINGTMTRAPDYSGEIIIATDSPDIDMLKGKKGVIFEKQFRREDIDRLKSLNMTFVGGTVFFRKVKNGESVSIDVEIGVIYK